MGKMLDNVGTRMLLLATDRQTDGKTRRQTDRLSLGCTAADFGITAVFRVDFYFIFSTLVVVSGRKSEVEAMKSEQCVVTPASTSSWKFVVFTRLPRSSNACIQ